MNAFPRAALAFHKGGTSRGEAPEPLYAVAFPASELWAHPEHPRDEVVLDLWQSYLEAP